MVIFYYQLYLNSWDCLLCFVGGIVYNFNIYVDCIDVFVVCWMCDVCFVVMSVVDQQIFINNYNFCLLINGSILIEDGVMFVEKLVYVDVVWFLCNNQIDLLNFIYIGKIMVIDMIYVFYQMDGSIMNICGNSIDVGSLFGLF